MSAATTNALSELVERAGASDQDRDAWLAERTLGVTATEVRDLVIKGPTFRRELIETKLGLRTGFQGNAYTVWGSEREPAIAAEIERVWGISPESRLFHAADMPRALCSPDGLGLDFEEQLVGEEIKTSGHWIAVGSPKYQEVGYELQMQWCMRVTGARRWLYVWEERLGTPEAGFFPGGLHTEWVEYDEATVQMLEAHAADFLDELDEARLQLAENGGLLVDEEIDTLAVNVLRHREDEGAAAKAKKVVWDQLVELLASRGDELSQKTALAQVTYRPAVEEEWEQPDEEAARALDPMDLWGDVEHARIEYEATREAWAQHQAAFTRTVTTVTKASLTVTAAKGTKKEKA